MLSKETSEKILVRVVSRLPSSGLAPHNLGIMRAHAVQPELDKQLGEREDETHHHKLLQLQYRRPQLQD